MEKNYTADDAWRHLRAAILAAGPGIPRIVQAGTYPVDLFRTPQQLAERAFSQAYPDGARGLTVTEREDVLSRAAQLFALMDEIDADFTFAAQRVAGRGLDA